jgi:hypothetical protein
MKKPRLRHPEGAAKRAAIAQRRVGEGARCACGETRPLALIPGNNPMICAKCQRQKRGHTVMDKHHPFGEANDPKTTILVPVNDHRAELNEAQNDWMKQTRENPDGSPLVWSASADELCRLLDRERSRPVLLAGLQTERRFCGPPGDPIHYPCKVDT